MHKFSISDGVSIKSMYKTQFDLFKSINIYAIQFSLLEGEMEWEMSLEKKNTRHKHIFVFNQFEWRSSTAM